MKRINTINLLKEKKTRNKNDKNTIINISDDDDDDNYNYYYNNSSENNLSLLEDDFYSNKKSNFNFSEIQKVNKINKIKKNGKTTYYFELITSYGKNIILNFKEIESIEKFEQILKLKLFNKNNKRLITPDVSDHFLSKAIKYFSRIKKLPYQLNWKHLYFNNNYNEYFKNINLNNKQFEFNNLIGRKWSISEKEYILMFRFKKNLFYWLEKEYFNKKFNLNLINNTSYSYINEIPELAKTKKGLISLNIASLRSLPNKSKEIKKKNYYFYKLKNDCFINSLQNIQRINFKEKDIRMLKKLNNLREKIDYINYLNFDFKIEFNFKEKIGLIDNVINSSKKDSFSFILAFELLSEEKDIDHCVGFRNGEICVFDEKFELAKGREIKYYKIIIKKNYDLVFIE
jgi:hypothetical protein